MSSPNSAAKMTAASSLFTARLEDTDPAVLRGIRDELKRQQTQIELIASENIVSRAVLEAQGSVLTNKYAEGYPGRRYYGGCEFVDVAETAGDRARQASCSTAPSPTSSRIPARRPTRRCSWPCCSRATPSSACRWPPAAT